MPMPRHPDPAVELRILEAAHKLWVRGGAEALTMRTVARAARTNTPAIYRRFKNRQDILRGLLLRIQQQVIQVMAQASSPQELCELYLNYSISHAREYELYFLHQNDILFAGRSRSRLSGQNAYPGREFVRKQLAGWLGGTPEEQTRLHLALWASMHGTAMLVNSKTVQGRAAEDLFAACRTSLRLILENALLLRQ
jgi:AcrR family transcriptional regulator